MKNNWDVAPMLEKGDTTDLALFEWVGRALSAWAQVEEQLYFLYQCLASSKNLASEAAFGSVVSLEARTTMIVVAAKRMLPSPARSPHTKKLLHLLKVVGNFSSRRNEIAHGQVTNFLGACYFLTHSYINSRKMKLATQSGPKDSRSVGFSYSYTSQQLEHYAGCFLTLKQEMYNLVEDILLSLYPNR